MAKKFFGKIIKKLLTQDKSANQIAKILSNKGATRGALQESAKKFVDPKKIKIATQIAKFLPSTAVATKTVTTGSKKVTAALEKSKKKISTKKKTTTTKKPLQGKEGTAKIRLGKWLNQHKDKDGAALYQAFKKDYPNATKQNVASALGNIIDKKKKVKANFIYKTLPNARKGNPGTTSKNIKLTKTGGMIKRPYGGKVYDPLKKVKRMGGGMVHDGNHEVSQLYKIH